jgi:hypothetical protein
MCFVLTVPNELQVSVRPFSPLLKHTYSTAKYWQILETVNMNVVQLLQFDVLMYVLNRSLAAGY